MIIAVFQALVMSVQMRSTIYLNSDWFAIFVIFLLLATSTLTISFMLSSIFDSTRNAAIVGTLVYFGSIFIFILYDQNVQPSFLVGLGCFFPIIFIFFASAGIAELEVGMTGLQFSTMTSNISGHTMLDCIFGSLAAIILHLVLIV